MEPFHLAYLIALGMWLGIVITEALRHLAAQVGASQIVLGSDHPIPWEEHPVDHVMATTTLSMTQRGAILGGNAARLLNIKDV